MRSQVAPMRQKLKSVGSTLYSAPFRAVVVPGLVPFGPRKAVLQFVAAAVDEMVKTAELMVNVTHTVRR